VVSCGKNLQISDISQTAKSAVNYDFQLVSVHVSVI